MPEKICTRAGLATGNVVTGKVALIAPAAIMTEAGVVATLVMPLERGTANPLPDAASFSVTVPMA